MWQIPNNKNEAEGKFLLGTLPHFTPWGSIWFCNSLRYSLICGWSIHHLCAAAEPLSLGLPDSGRDRESSSEGSGKETKSLQSPKPAQSVWICGSVQYCSQKKLNVGVLRCQRPPELLQMGFFQASLLQKPQICLPVSHVSLKRWRNLGKQRCLPAHFPSLTRDDTP